MADQVSGRVALGDINRHFWLFRSVAKAMGIDTASAMAEGSLSAVDYSEMLTRCRSGGCDAGCALWLAQQQDYADAAPDFCANQAALDHLKDRTNAAGPGRRHRRAV